MIARRFAPRNPFLTIIGAEQQSETLGVTRSCAKRIRYLANKRGDASCSSTYLRVSVDAGGCSGFQYEFEVIADEDEGVDAEEDVVFYGEHGGVEVRVVSDIGSIDFLHGSKIDYVEEMIRSAFAVVDNPNSESACGCGSSFAMKNFAQNTPE